MKDYMENTFYRYLRPVYFDAERHMPVTAAKGGVSFKVIKHSMISDLNGENTGLLHVTAAITLCSKDVVFNKAIARQYLEMRNASNATCEFIVGALDAESLAKGFILSTDEDAIASSNVYIKDSFKRYADGIEDILKTHKQASVMSKLSRESIEALNIKSEYI